MADITLNFAFGDCLCKVGSAEWRRTAPFLQQKRCAVYLEVDAVPCPPVSFPYHGKVVGKLAIFRSNWREPESPAADFRHYPSGFPKCDICEIVLGRSWEPKRGEGRTSGRSPTRRAW